MENIYQVAKQMEQNLLNGAPIKIGKFATHDHSTKVSTIESYLNSQHISGSTDSLGREKPFFNICLLAVYTWFKATDIDRKNIRFKAPNAKQRLKALIATILLRNWMNKEHFGAFLNKWGWKGGAYGSVVLKFVEKGQELTPTVISWDRLICDPVDFENNPKIEKLFFTPAQLRKQNYDEKKVEEAINALEEARTNLEGEKIDVQSEYIGLYEVHGELPLSFLTGKESDEKTYRQQMHVIFIQEGAKDEEDVEITLYSGKEKKDPYYITHLIEQDGRTLSIGAVESLFDAQWMANHSMKQVKDQLDLASKLLQQTSDQDFVGRNILTEVDTGSILITKKDEPLTQVNNQSHDIPQIIASLEQWRQLAREVSNSTEAVTGEQPPSGTPYRLQALLNAEANGLFILMRENKGLHLEEIMRRYVLPHFKKTLKNSDEVISILEGEELETFDELSLPARMETELMAGLKEGYIPTREDIMGVVGQQNEDLGSTRHIRPSADKNMTWEEYFGDFDMEALDVEITDENVDPSRIQNLNSLLQTIMPTVASNPMVLEHPTIKKLLGEIVDELGPGTFSPLKFAKGANQAMQQQMPQAVSTPQVGMGAEPVGASLPV